MDASALVKQFAQDSARRNYMWLPDSIRHQAGDEAHEYRLVKDVLTGLLDGFTLDSAPLLIPDSIAYLYEQELERIKSLVVSGDESSLRFDLDVRQKDLILAAYGLEISYCLKAMPSHRKNMICIKLDTIPNPHKLRNKGLQKARLKHLVKSLKRLLTVYDMEKALSRLL